MTEVTEMPGCNDIDMKRIPPSPFQQESSKNNIDLDYVSNSFKQIFCQISTIEFFAFFFLISKDIEEPNHEREDIMASLKERWIQVRKNWMEHSKEYEEKKYGTNIAILEALYKK